MFGKCENTPYLTFGATWGSAEISLSSISGARGELSTTTIPRDPANLQVDLAATVRLKETLGALMNYRGQAPTDVAEYESATVKNILLSVGGAKIAAAGDMTFDTAGPVPLPNGVVDVNITGVQGLVNTLSSIGLVPQAQAGMAMGMMMAFVQPGSEPDSFTSKVEFRNGQIIANGIPVGP